MTFKWQGDKIKKAMRDGAEQALHAAVEVYVDASQAAAPEDTGGLKASMQVDIDESTLRAEISYGRGLPDERAAITHEKVEIHHDNGTAKFLENPLRDRADALVDELADGIRRKLK